MKNLRKYLKNAFFAINLLLFLHFIIQFPFQGALDPKSQRDTLSIRLSTADIDDSKPTFLNSDQASMKETIEGRNFLLTFLIFLEKSFIRLKSTS